MWFFLCVFCMFVVFSGKFLEHELYRKQQKLRKKIVHCKSFPVGIICVSEDTFLREQKPVFLWRLPILSKVKEFKETKSKNELSPRPSSSNFNFCFVFSRPESHPLNHFFPIWNIFIFFCFFFIHRKFICSMDDKVRLQYESAKSFFPDQLHSGTPNSDKCTTFSVRSRD